MQRKNENIGGFSVSEAKLRQLLQSKEGQQLIARLQAQGKDAVTQAVGAAQNGDMEAAKAAVQALLKDPGTAALAKRLRNG